MGRKNLRWCWFQRMTRTFLSFHVGRHCWRTISGTLHVTYTLILFTKRLTRFVWIRTIKYSTRYEFSARWSVSPFYSFRLRVFNGKVRGIFDRSQDFCRLANLVSRTKPSRFFPLGPYEKPPIRLQSNQRKTSSPELLLPLIPFRICPRYSHMIIWETFFSTFF